MRFHAPLQSRPYLSAGIALAVLVPVAYVVCLRSFGSSDIDVAHISSPPQSPTLRSLATNVITIPLSPDVAGSGTLLLCSPNACNDMQFRSHYFESIIVAQPVTWRMIAAFTPIDLYVHVRPEKGRWESILVALWRDQAPALLQWFDFSFVSLVHIDDERTRHITRNEDSPYYSRVKHTYRNYFADNMYGSTYLALGWTNVPSATRDLLRANPPHRNHSAYFAGHVDANYRTELARATTELRSEGYDVVCAGSEAFRSTAVPSNAYYIKLHSVTFCPIPCGTNPETYRLWEALISGCIPVVEVCDTLLVEGLGLPFQFTVRNKDWRSALVAAFTTAPADLDRSYLGEETVHTYLWSRGFYISP